MFSRSFRPHLDSMTRSPSVRMNALANYLGQGVSTLVGIVFVRSI